MSWDDAVGGVDRDTPGGRPPRAWEVAQRLGLRAANDDVADDRLLAYAELHCLSDFSFLRGAASAEELFARAAQCGYEALAITDECSLAGIVRGLEAARATGLRLIVGSEFALSCGLRCVLLVETQAGYVRLCELITRARRAARKGEYRLSRDDLADVLAARPGETGGCGLFALWLPAERPDAADARWLQGLLGDRVHLAVELHRDRDDAARLARLLALAAELGLQAVAAGDVHMDVRRRRALQDTMTAIRHNTPLADCGAHLFRNGERHLRTRRALGNIYPPALLEAAVRLARRCTFDLDQLRYAYPAELVPDGHTPTSWLRALTEAGMRRRWPDAVPESVAAQIDGELALIAELRYEAFFLTVEDIVRHARSRGILCQGRGSSANSAVCFALGITVVDPAESRLLMARFLSRERNEPPDIDVDFEHERREEVLQYVYAKYGRERAALAATVIRYRGKSAVRDVAKAFGLPPDQVALLAECYGWGNGEAPMEQRLREAGFDPDNPLIARVLLVTEQLREHPRHLSQHVGGFVISDAALSTVVPVENAAMPDRTIIQWDKDDLETMRLLKVDCLALGMLTCIRKALDLVERHRGYRIDLAQLPSGDAPTYAMIQAADTVGVFQIESRAQMSMLPRLKPKNFYDLVIEVAIVRPGPIQGDMVHPYLHRRANPQDVTYPSEELRGVLHKTLGVPLFQEQAMQLAITAAGFSEARADQLRRAMGTFKGQGQVERFRAEFTEGMVARGYERDFAERCFRQIEGFGSYGFPESHAASFAQLVYTSAWIKRHHPAAFACSLLNSQPMGFYAPAQLVRDAREHGVRVLPVDVHHSDRDCTLEPDPGSTGGLALRLGLRLVQGLNAEAAGRLLATRPFRDMGDAVRRAALPRDSVTALARADAFRSLGLDSRAALWAARAAEPAPPPDELPLFAAAAEAAPVLPALTDGERLALDWGTTGLSLRAHPLALLRPWLGPVDTRSLGGTRRGARIRLPGLVLVRQRPGSSKGVVFFTVEDEYGTANLVLYPDVVAAHRPAVLGARLLVAEGRLEREDSGAVPILHLIVRRLEDHSAMLDGLHRLDLPGGAFPADSQLARADEIGRGGSPRSAIPRLGRSRDFH